MMVTMVVIVMAVVVIMFVVMAIVVVMMMFVVVVIVVVMVVVVDNLLLAVDADDEVRSRDAAARDGLADKFDSRDVKSVKLGQRLCGIGLEFKKGGGEHVACGTH